MNAKERRPGLAWRLGGAVAACLLLSGCGQNGDEKADSGPGENPLTAPADYVGTLGKGKQQAERTVETAGLKQAIQLFYAQEGRYPKTLNELVSPDYLNSLPEPPAGMKFDYKPATGELKVVPR